MQNPMGGRILLSNILLVIVALLFMYAIYGIATSPSDAKGYSINKGIENKKELPLPEDSQIPDIAHGTENGKDKSS